MDANPDLRLDDEESDGVVFFGALRAALSRIPIWLLTWGVFLLLALMAALPWHDFYASAIGDRYEPGALVSSLDRTLLGDVSDTSFRFDHRAELSALNEKTAATGTLLAFAAILLGLFAAGGWLQIILERTRGQSVRRFFFGGARYFFRFLRLLVLSLLILAVFGWLIYGKPWEHFVLGDWLGVPGYDRDSLETLESEWTVVQLKWAQAALYAIVFALTVTWGDYTRTRMALHDTSSALWSGFLTFFTMLRHPIKTLRPMIGLLVVEAIALAAAFAVQDWVASYLDGSPTRTKVWLLILIGQLALMWRHITRGARYHAAVEVSRQIVRPLSRPDPWKESIGGPGGPRYPLGEGDEYGVAL